MFKRHRRFLIALALGLAAGLVVVGKPAGFRLLVGIDVFCLVFLILMYRFAHRLTPSELKRTSSQADEGIWVILIVAACVAVASLGLVFGILNTSRSWAEVDLLLAVVGVPLGWAMLQTLIALHYARIYYTDAASGGDGGLRFERTDEPGLWDFLYVSYTVAMTTAVSDNVVTSTPMRRAILFHGVLSFAYNAIILALAVNAATSLN